MTAYYFGCGRGAGHFFWVPGDRGFRPAPTRTWPSWCPPELPWREKEIDGKLTPGRRDHRGRLPYEQMSRSHQGEAALHHRAGWTALAVHDFTVDTRPGSNSVFFFDQTLDLVETLAAAAAAFPQVMARIGPVTVRPPSAKETAS